MSRILKAFNMLHYLNVHDVVSLETLSYHLDLSERSVQRLRLDLLEAGFEIETIMGPGGGYRLKKQGHFVSQDLTLEERRTLKQALPLLQQYQSELGNDLITGLSKLSNLLNYQYHTTVPSFQSIRLNVNPDLYQKNMEKIEKSILNKKKIKINYQKNYRELNQYIFEPYALIIVNNMWYVAGYDQKNRYLSLKVNRIVEIELLEQSYFLDESVSKTAGISKFGYKIQPVSAIIEVTDMDYISEFIWGENQEIDWINDHCFILKVTFPNVLAFKKFVLGAGSKMKVTEPKWARDWLLEEAMKIMKLYQ